MLKLDGVQDNECEKYDIKKKESHGHRCPVHPGRYSIASLEENENEFRYIKLGG